MTDLASSDRLGTLSDAGVSIWLDDLSRERIESGSLLFKVRVVSSDLQERRKAAVRPTGQPSSL